MKSTFLIISLLFSIAIVYSQQKLKLKLTDDTIVTSLFNNTGAELIDLVSKDVYTINDLKEVLYYENNDSIHYHVIDTKTYLTSKKSRRQISRLGYKGKSIELYYVFYNWTSMHTNGMMSNQSYDEAFVRRKGESFAYNMGYIYGAGYKGVKKRVREYFTDCPELIEMVNKNKIHKRKTNEMVQFYDDHCGAN